MLKAVGFPRGCRGGVVFELSFDRSSRLAGVAGVLILVAFLAACSDPTGPFNVDRDTLLVAFRAGFSDSARLELRGVQSGRRLGRRLFTGRSVPTTADSESGVVYARHFDGTEGSDELLAMEMRSLDVLWRERIDRLEAQLAAGTEITLGSGSLFLAPDGRRLYMLARRGPDEEPGEFGVVVVDVNTQSPVGYLGGFKTRSRKSATLRTLDGEPQLLVVGGPRSEDAVRLMIYRDEGEGRPVLRDSVFLFEPPPLERAVVRLDMVISGRDGRHVYVRSADSIFKVDVREGRIVERGTRVRFVLSAATVVRDPVRLVFTDAGSFDFPGSGALQLYDGDLNDLGTIEGLPGAQRGITVGPREERVFVTSGMAAGNFTQVAQLTVVNVRERRVVRVHDIDGFAVSDVHALK